MVDNPVQKRWKSFLHSTRRYSTHFWRFPEARKMFLQVVWRRPLLIVKWLFIIAGIIFIPILLVKVILFGYTLPFTGFNEHPVHDPKQYQPGKTLWDWLQLLIIPAVLAVGGTIFNRLLDERSRDIATDQQQQTALQNYLDEMSKLLTANHLRDPESKSAERDIARALTLTVLPGLDPLRKGRVLRFLYETGLICKDNIIVDLCGANFSNLRIHETRPNSKYIQMTGARISLRKANLRGTIFRDASLELVDLGDACLENVYMSSADLSGTWLSNASMEQARLNGSNLYKASLKGAHMQKVQLRGAYLREADLQGADLQGADLQAANLQNTCLKDAKMQDVNLSEADLRGADLTKVQSGEAKLLRARF